MKGSKRQRKKIYKKMGVWGFDAIVTGCRTKAGGHGIKHGIPIGSPVTFLKIDPTSIYCDPPRGVSQWVHKDHLKKIR